MTTLPRHTHIVHYISSTNSGHTRIGQKIGLEYKFYNLRKEEKKKLKNAYKGAKVQLSISIRVTIQKKN